MGERRDGVGARRRLGWSHAAGLGLDFELGWGLFGDRVELTAGAGGVLLQPHKYTTVAI